MAGGLTRQASERLIGQLVMGALEADAVRVHGAIVATFELFPAQIASEVVFAPALAELDGWSAAHRRAAAAINGHRPLYDR